MSRPLKGFREFPPEVMAARRRVVDVLTSVPARFGYREIDVPSVEPLEIFRLKSGDEVVDQTFSFRDKGGREVTLIPETTPSVARAVASASRSSPLPLRWYSFTRLWRYEDPQAGRTREFFQLNVDAFGTGDVKADAEILAVAAGILRALGLEGDVRIHISDRRLLDGVLAPAGVGDVPAVCRVLDKMDKAGWDPVREMLISMGLDDELCETLRTLTGFVGDLRDRISDVESVIGESDATRRLRILGEMLEWYSVEGLCRLDPGVVRGLDYYTSLVFEGHDTRREMRALFGGGRYDSLVSLLGGPDIPAVGFAMGDVVLERLMRRAGTWPGERVGTDCVVAVADGSAYALAVRFASRLREMGLVSELDIMSRSLAKQMRYADRMNARWTVILGRTSVEEGRATLRDMRSGEQVDLPLDEIYARLGTGAAQGQ